jgi:hypothetical protein
VENPDERLTAEEAAGSTWLNRRFAATTRGPTEQEMDNTTTSLTAYANYHKLKKLVSIVVFKALLYRRFSYLSWHHLAGSHGDCSQVNVGRDWDLTQSI